MYRRAVKCGPALIVYPWEVASPLSFSDLHSCWAMYEARHFLRSLGDLNFTDSGSPYWVNELGVVSLCRFRDKVMVPSSYPDSSHTHLVQRICTMLGKAWNLRVLCECHSTHDTCQGTCHNTRVTAMGFCMVRGRDGTGLVYVHPNAVSQTWSLKQGAPLKSLALQHTGYVTAIFTGALAASVPWCTTLGAQLLSVSAPGAGLRCCPGIRESVSHGGHTVRSSVPMPLPPCNGKNGRLHPRFAAQPFVHGGQHIIPAITCHCPQGWTDATRSGPPHRNCLPSQLS